MRISFLVHNVYGVGGTNRTVINLASELSHRHEVEIVSILRRVDRPKMEIPSRVTVTGLVDLRPGSEDARDPRAREVSAIVPHEEEFFRFYSRLSDERIGGYLRRTPYDVVVGTRSALNLAVARLGRPGSVRIAQEHMTQDMIPEQVHDAYREWYPQLSAVTAVTQADAAAVHAVLGAGAPSAVAIPNSVPDPMITPAGLANKIVVAAGRLDEIKRYDLLVRAFAKVAANRPDWSLRIYGSGGERAGLAALIADLGLQNHVFLMGSYAPLEAEWVKGSIAAVTSDKESFGMTIVEAMRCGLPVVSTNCPVGPGEIIQDGVDGRLVGPGDVDGIATALLDLINDQPLRVRMGAAALTNSRRYDPVPIAARYEQLFEQHLTAPAPRRSSRGLKNPAGQLKSSTKRALYRVLPGLKLRGGTAKGPVVTGRVVDGRVLIDAPGADLPLAMTQLVCRPRRIEGVTKAVRFPLTRIPGGWQAAFPAFEPVLAEGRWDVYLADRHDGLHRLRSGLLDIREFIGGPAGDVFARNVPYPTADGYLAVAAYRREHHVEAGDIGYEPGAITVTCRAVNFTPGPDLTLVRRGDLPGELTVPSLDGGLTFAVPVAELAARRLARLEDWDAYLSHGSELVPVSRLMDDVVERKRVYQYPPVLVDDSLPVTLYEESPASEVRVRPYFSIRSILGFAVSDDAV